MKTTKKMLFSQFISFLILSCVSFIFWKMYRSPGNELLYLAGALITLLLTLPCFLEYVLYIASKRFRERIDKLSNQKGARYPIRWIYLSIAIILLCLIVYIVRVHL